MSNHTPQVQTNLTVTRSLAATVIVALVVLTILLFALAGHMFAHASGSDDLLFVIAGILIIGLGCIPGKFLIDILAEAIARTD